MHFYNKKAQRIGEMTDNGTGNIFRKTVKGSKHLMKKLDAWAIDTDIIDRLEELGCKEIRIKDLETGEIYKVAFQEFREKAIKRDFGFNNQSFLPRRYWEVSKITNN